MASRILIVVCALAILATPAAPLPYPGANDAGTGSDAGDYRQVATEVEAGRYGGEVGWDIRTPVAAWEYDWKDVYAFDPPANSSIQITVEVPGAYVDDNTLLHVDVEGPDGGDGDFIWGTGRTAPVRNRSTLTVSSVRDGAWYLTLTDLNQAGAQRYQFEIEYRQFDHGVLLDGEGALAAAWEVDFPSGVPGQIGASLVFPGPPQEVEGEDHVVGVWFERTPAFGCREAWVVPGPWWAKGGTGRNGLDGEDLLWTEGSPEDVDGPSPLGTVPLPDSTDHAFGLDLPVPDGNATVHWAYADFEGVGVVGVVLWDGPDNPSTRRVRAEAEFLTLQDFEASDGGFGVQIGPAAYAEDLHAEVTVPEDFETDIVYANAYRSRSPRRVPFIGEVPLSASTPTMHVEVPNGTTRTFQDDFFYWIPLDMPPSNDPWVDEDVPSGGWRFHLDRVDGLEGDEVRVMRLGFDFPLACPE